MIFFNLVTLWPDAMVSTRIKLTCCHNCVQLICSDIFQKVSTAFNFQNKVGRSFNNLGTCNFKFFIINYLSITIITVNLLKCITNKAELDSERKMSIISLTSKDLLFYRNVSVEFYYLVFVFFWIYTTDI
jgi:hypothetical protein